MAVDNRIADHAQMAQRGGGHILQGNLHLLPLTMAQPVPFCRQKRRDHEIAGHQIPRRQGIGDRRVMALRPGHVGDAKRRVHGVIHLRAALAVPHQRHHDQITAVLAEGFVIHPAAHPQVGQELPRILARRGDDPGDKLFAPRGCACSPPPISCPCSAPPRTGFAPKAPSGQRPASKPAFDPVKADHLGPHLRQGHPAKGTATKAEPSTTRIPSNIRFIGFLPHGRGLHPLMAALPVQSSRPPTSSSGSVP